MDCVSSITGKGYERRMVKVVKEMKGMRQRTTESLKESRKQGRCDLLIFRGLEELQEQWAISKRNRHKHIGIKKSRRGITLRRICNTVKKHVCRLFQPYSVFVTEVLKTISDHATHSGLKHWHSVSSETCAVIDKLVVDVAADIYIVVRVSSKLSHLLAKLLKDSG